MLIWKKNGMDGCFHLRERKVFFAALKEKANQNNPSKGK
jgi:hypothetical protein